jgi:hypothetical protein
VSHFPDGDYVKCQRCGNFRITGSALAVLANQTPEIVDLISPLSAYTRQANSRGEEATLDSANWRDRALAHKATPFNAKSDKLLSLLIDRSKPGEPTKIDYDLDPPLVDAFTGGELTILLEHLNEMGYIREVNAVTHHFTVRPKGWQWLESAKAAGGIRGKCFVAMSFDHSLDEAYDNGIHLAVKNDCKMEPVRIDRVHHNEKICDKLIAEIRACQFLIADVTCHRPSVYFEAGFAMALSRPVIWTCRRDDFENVHFDTRQYSHIVWDTPNDLRIQLTDRIRATILT